MDNIEKGSILISSRVVDKQILIYVTDTACGIEPSALKKVFDPFYTTKKEGEGTGLGLAISYDIIKEHNGDLAVSSELGKGSQFTISLPLTNAVLH
jgi:two-component system NtrC family sensor kinase